MQPSIKVKLASLAVVASAALLQSAPARADALATRCAADPMTPARARLRLEWARACGTTLNLVSPTSPRAPAFAYLTGLTSANGGIPLWEYIETTDFWGQNSYSGDEAAVNQIFTESQWRVGPYTATTDAAGFQKWTVSDTLALARPIYPIFGNNLDINSGSQLFANPNYALHDCTLYTDRAATHRADTSTTGFYVNAFCSSNNVTCGDGVCTSGETSSSCPSDCPPCGDGVCSFNENPSTCPSDCAVCGDGLCTGSETAFSCSFDCAVCGDGICSIGETQTCPIDCGFGGGCGCGGGGTTFGAAGPDTNIVICQTQIICPL